MRHGEKVNRLTKETQSELAKIRNSDVIKMKEKIKTKRRKACKREYGNAVLVKTTKLMLSGVWQPNMSHLKISQCPRKKM